MATKKKNDNVDLTPEDVEQYYEIDNEIKRLDKKKKLLAAKIKNAADPGEYTAGEYIVSLKETIGVLNKPVFVHVFPHDEFPELYENVPSTEKIKEYLGEDRKEYYTPTVRLSVKKRGN